MPPAILLLKTDRRTMSPTQSETLQTPHLQIDVVQTQQRGNFVGRHKYLAVGAAGAALFALGIGADRGLDIAGHLGGGPASVEAGVDQRTIVATDVTMDCSANVTEYVGVTGKQGFTAGSKTIDKKYAARFMFCGDDDQLHAQAKLTVNSKTGKVVREDIEQFPLPLITNPAVDLLQTAGCAPLRAEDDPAAIAQKLADYEKDVADGGATCDTGIDEHYFGETKLFGHTIFPGVFALNPKDDIGPAAMTAAQVAVGLGGYPVGGLQEQVAALELQMRQQEAGRNHLDVTDVHVQTGPTTAALPNFKQRYEQLGDGMFTLFPEQHFENVAGDTRFIAKSSAGVELNVTLGGGIVMNDAQLSELNSFVQQKLAETAGSN